MTTSRYSTTISDDALLSWGSMEGIALPDVHARPPLFPRKLILAMTAAAAIAIAAYTIHALPFAPFQVSGQGGVRHPISAAIIAILLGILVRNGFRVPSWLGDGARTIVRRSLPIVIVLAGAEMNLSQIAGVGLPAIGIVFMCVLAATLVSLYLGRFFGLGRRTSLLIGAGTAICGTSAIVTVASSLHAEDDEITMSAATVNLLGLALMFTLPVLGGLLHMKENAVGIWAGSSIQAVPQAVAAGYAFGPEAGSVATLVKLVRVALLVPYSIFIAFLFGSRSHLGSENFVQRAIRTVPGFLWGFVALAILASANLVPTLQFTPAWLPAGQSYSVTLRALLSQASNILLAFVMAALGLEVGLRSVARVGRPAMLTGFAAMCAVCALSWILITLSI
jgi:uncharacterized integral membrane protein (TIGR00698 family)